ncbi:alpha/beta fold hydrolase [Bdellovibrio sp. HCB337]|uniref:alpha/beta fold hydrolase n=1 Tax=Bdellovibrio sp. HCB337 TaxID=3394358 RepID=UPI0039A4699C
MRLLTLGILTVLLNVRIAVAIPEAELKEAMSSKVAAYLAQNGRYESISGQRGLSLASFTLEGTGDKGDVLLIPGQGEFIPKYYELAYDLVQRGYSMIYILDHRGQGASERLLPQSPEKGSVESFSDYAKDLGNYIQSIRSKRQGQKLFLVAHSMGAGVSALTLREGMVDAVVFSAPMLGVRAPVVYDTRYLMPLLLTLCKTEKMCNNFAPGKEEFNLYLDFDKNVLTHSKARWSLHQSMLQENPSIGIQGPTNRWVLQATKAVKRIAKIAPPKDIPMLLFQAGEDEVVLPKQQTQYCAKAKSCQLIKVPGARHEILQETDSLRTKVIDRIDRFFATH